MPKSMCNMGKCSVRHYQRKEPTNERQANEEKNIIEFYLIAFAYCIG